MRKSAWFLAVLGFGVFIAAVSLPASDIREVDYPVQYQVMTTGKESKLAVDKKCTMTLVDKAKPEVAINVWKRGIGSCQTLDPNTVYRGRENDKKNEIEIVIPVGETKARIDTWQIIGTVDMKPKSDRPGA